MSHINNVINQVEDPLLASIKQELGSISSKNTTEPELKTIKKGTNKLLWNSPTYSVVGVDLNDTKTENPNAFWKKWAEEQEKNNQIN